MSKFFDIQLTLQKELKRLCGLRSVPCGNIDEPLSTSSRGAGMWVELYAIPGESIPATLGDKGTDHNPGIVQVDINVPLSEGSGNLLKLADFIASALPAGKGLVYTGGVVKIERVSLSPGRGVGGFYKRSLSVYYYSRTPRNH